MINMIKAAQKAARETGKEWMVMRDRYGAVQSFPYKEKLPDGYKIMYRTSEDKNKTTFGAEMDKMMAKFNRVV